MEVREENLRNFVVGSMSTLYYVPDFITDSEQDQLLTNIYQAPVSKWKSLKNRRLQNWGGAVHEKGLIAQDLPPWLTRITQRISDESMLFPSAINHVLINEYLPNQGIMPHQDGPAYFPVVAIVSLGSPVVMDFSPHSGLTLCTNTFRNNIEDKVSDSGAREAENDTLLENHYPFSVALMPRSLLVFKDKAYSDYLHGIKDCHVQRYDGAVNVSETREHLGVIQTLSGSEDSNSIHRTTNRISLTCRVVSKQGRRGRGKNSCLIMKSETFSGGGSSRHHNREDDDDNNDQADDDHGIRIITLTGSNVGATMQSNAESWKPIVNCRCQGDDCQVRA